MIRQSYYRVLFRAVAVWSWVISVAYFIGDSVDEPFLRRVLPAVRPRVLLDMAVLPTFLFGFAFWWVSRDLTQNRAIPAVGAAGSILAPGMKHAARVFAERRTVCPRSHTSYGSPSATSTSRR